MKLDPINEEIKNYFLEFLKRIGLEDFKVQVESSMGIEHCYYLGLSKKIEYVDLIKGRHTGMAKTLMEPTLDKIQNSDYVKQCIADKDADIERLRGELIELEQRIAELTPYEQYYKLALKMNHGGKSEEV